MSYRVKKERKTKTNLATTLKTILSSQNTTKSINLDNSFIVSVLSASCLLLAVIFLLVVQIVVDCYSRYVVTVL